MVFKGAHRRGQAKSILIVTVLISSAQGLLTSLDEALAATSQDLRDAEAKLQDPECLSPLPGNHFMLADAILRPDTDPGRTDVAWAA